MPDTIAQMTAIMERARRQTPREAIAEAVRRHERSYSTNELIAALHSEIQRLEAEA